MKLNEKKESHKNQILPKNDGVQTYVYFNYSPH